MIRTAPSGPERARGPGPAESGGGGGAAGGLGGLVVATRSPFRARGGRAGVVRDRRAGVPAADRRVGDLAEPVDQLEPLARREPGGEQAPGGAPPGTRGRAGGAAR